MKHVLYVEDDAINALVVKKFLNNGFNVTHVFDGEACMKAVAEGSFDVILMDINLGKGKMDGVETLHQLRAQSRPKPYVVIAVTSYALPEDRERFLQEGFDAYLAKPVDRKELIDLIHHYAGS